MNPEPTMAEASTVAIKYAAVFLCIVPAKVTHLNCDHNHATRHMGPQVREAAPLEAHLQSTI